MLFTTLTLLSSAALACTEDAPCSDHADVSVLMVTVERDIDEPVDDTEDDDTGCDSKSCRRGDPGHLVFRGAAVDLGQRSAWGLELRAKGRRDGWIGLEGTWADDDAWMGRVGVGLDLFGRSSFDLGLGLVGGHLGDWQTDDNKRFSIGTEVLVGWQPGRCLFEHRHLGGARPGGGIRTENRTKIGGRPWKALELFAEFVSIDPGAQHDYGIGGGLGLRL